jgi:hypothetical protein
LTGATAADVALNSTATSDNGLVAIGHVGTGGLVASGDTTTATAMPPCKTPPWIFSSTARP